MPNINESTGFYIQLVQFPDGVAPTFACVCSKVVVSVVKCLRCDALYLLTHVQIFSYSIWGLLSIFHNFPLP